jgi:flagellar biosynthesis GTPase FlhF
MVVSARQPTPTPQKTRRKQVKNTTNNTDRTARAQKAAATRAANKARKAAEAEAAAAAAAAEAEAEAARQEALEQADERERSRQSAALQAARVRYERGVAASGRPTQHNGDPVARALVGLWPAQALDLAERLCGLEAGSLAVLYAERNPGSQRMNAGNRLRGWLRREQKAGRGQEALEALLRG